MNRPKHIVEAPSNLGLKEPALGQEPGVRGLPSWLQKHGLYNYIGAEAIHRVTPPSYGTLLDQVVGVRNAEQIAAYSQELAHVTTKLVGEGIFSIVIGGDCSILLGTMLGLKKAGRYGLFFLDGHTDFIGPELSQTGGAAGMDLALVTGHGHDKLTDIDREKPYVKEAHVWCVGNREYDASYVQPIKDSDIHYYSLAALREEGIASCVRKFLVMIDEEQLDGFWIHVDVDVLNDEIMPAVDSRQPEGLSYREFKDLLKALTRSEKAVGLQVTILDPSLDASGEITSQFVENIGPMLAML